MESAAVDNDTRGWIMTVVSGIACIVGSCIVCVDLIVQRFPGRRNFRIQENSVFLACSLSLSFGVMLFSGLYSMLPSAKEDLVEGGLGEQAAGFIMMGCFIAGFIGIQVLSRVLHQFMPSHVVDCDHSHEEHIDGHSQGHSERGSRRSSRLSHSQTGSARRTSSATHAKVLPDIGSNGNATDSTPLLPTEVEVEHSHHHHLHYHHPHFHNGGLEPVRRKASAMSEQLPPHGPPRIARSRATTGAHRRPSLLDLPSRVMSFVKDTKSNCDEFGPCYGYSDPCGQECFKHIGRISSRTPPLLRTHTRPHPSVTSSAAALPELPDEESNLSTMASSCRTSRAQSRDFAIQDSGSDCESHCGSSDAEAQHHHHVPTNAFLSIGLQTVIAIALHKFPEGFITYATNHANPQLGFNVFMALFVHNITEGFAMALPLYMALGSRFKAIAWSSALGGLSQPVGAGVAALWFRIARRQHIEIDSVAYACVFAVTAGIMTSVALQLFVESLSLNHNRNLSIGFAFLGMVILGLSNAFVNE